MKKLLVFASLFCLGFSANSQTLSPTVIASAGGFAQAGNVSLSFSVGEMAAIQTLASSNLILTQGFHQPSDFPVSVLNIKPSNIFVGAYPNPATDFVNLSYEFSKPAKLELGVYDAIGRLVSDKQNLAYYSGREQHTIKTNHLAAGIYFLKLDVKYDNGFKETLSERINIQY